MDNIINANLTISGVEETVTQIKIKDENKKTYSFFKTKKDGGMTKAYEAFQQYKVGDTVGIGYKEVAFTGKDGTQGKIKSILSFGPVNSAAMLTKNAPQPVSSSTGATYRERMDKKEADDEQVFWEKKAYKQCLWGYWLSKECDIPLSIEEAGLVWQVFNQIEQDADKRFSTGWAKAEATFKGNVPPQHVVDVDMEMGNAAIAKAQADMVDGIDF